MAAVRAVAQALALRPCPGLLRDPHFGLALAAGPAFWLLLAARVPLHPLAPAQALSETFLYLALAAPVMEELAFRGALMGWFHDYAWGARRHLGLTRANWTAAALFTALHFAYHPPLWAASVVFPALLYGHLRDRHDSVLPPMFLHVFYNAGYFALTGLPAVPGAGAGPVS